MSQTLETLLDAAESDIRLRGYHAVSFRELADEIGIKSSSVHYYFRQKEDLGLALVERYRERFFSALEKLTSRAETPEERLGAFVALYRQALVGSDRICLCVMLGVESRGLPSALAKAVAAFFEANIGWLVNAMPASMPADERQSRAIHIVGTLQGAMLLASALGDHAIFDAAAQDLMADRAA
ncbi:MAG: TetR/AcrR family transcriptional regulator [Pseudomonadota bacterium]